MSLGRVLSRVALVPPRVLYGYNDRVRLYPRADFDRAFRAPTRVAVPVNWYASREHLGANALLRIAEIGPQSTISGRDSSVGFGRLHTKSPPFLGLPIKI